MSQSFLGNFVNVNRARGRRHTNHISRDFPPFQHLLFIAVNVKDTYWVLYFLI